ELHVILEDAHEARIRLQIEARIAPRVEDLWHQADIGETGRVAMTERPGLAVARQRLLDALEAERDPMIEPALDIRLLVAELTRQVLQHAQIVDRMDVAG